MNEAEYAVYQEWFDFLTGRTGCDGFLVENNQKDHQKKHPSIRVDLILYLKASPEVCLQRIHSRKRQEETKIPLQYLANLDQLHDNWLSAPQEDERFVAPVLTIPAEGSKADMERIFQEISPYVLGEKILKSGQEVTLDKTGIETNLDKTGIETNNSLESNDDFVRSCTKENLVLN